jgi:hypothetical protein
MEQDGFRLQWSWRPKSYGLAAGRYQERYRHQGFVEIAGWQGDTDAVFFLDKSKIYIYNKNQQ